MITSINEFRNILNENSDNIFTEGNIKFNLLSTGREDWDRDLNIQTDGKDRYHRHVDYMSPEEFLERVQSKRFQTDYDKVKKYRDEIINSDSTVLPTPTMWFSNRDQHDSGLSPSWHDGSHRALALKELGVNKIPVMVVYDVSRYV
jgi:hypothetical protein